MEGYCSTGQSPQRAVIPMERKRERERERERERRERDYYFIKKERNHKIRQHYSKTFCPYTLPFK
jgi:hypothetical protein